MSGCVGCLRLPGEQPLVEEGRVRSDSARIEQQQPTQPGHSARGLGSIDVTAAISAGKVYAWRVVSSHEVVAEHGKIFQIERTKEKETGSSLADAFILARDRLTGTNDPSDEGAVDDTKLRSTKTVGGGLTKGEARELFGKSHPGAVLGCYAFISHSWSASRALKTLAINFAFNGTAALIAALLVALVALALMLTWRVKHGAMLPPQAYLLVAVPPLLAYVYVLLHGQRLLPWIRRFVFLDRLCVHQANDSLKQAGIQTLGDVVLASQNLLVLLSTDYLERLWCIFELATFTASHDEDAIVAVPLWLPPILFAFSSVFASSGIAWYVFGPVTLAYVSLWLCWLGPVWGQVAVWTTGFLMHASLISYALLKKVSYHLELDERLAHFSLADAKVTVESDRAIVMHEITQLHGSPENFEDLVRNRMRQKLRKALGPPGRMLYSHTMLIATPIATWALKDATAVEEQQELEIVGCRASDGTPYGQVERTLAGLWFYGAMAFICIPIAFTVCGSVAELLLRKHYEAPSKLRFRVCWLCCVMSFAMTSGSSFLLVLLLQHHVLFRTGPCHAAADR